MLTHDDNAPGRGLGRYAHSGGGVVNDEELSLQTAVKSLAVGCHDLCGGPHIQLQRLVHCQQVLVKPAGVNGLVGVFPAYDDGLVLRRIHKRDRQIAVVEGCHQHTGPQSDLLDDVGGRADDKIGYSAVVYDGDLQGSFFPYYMPGRKDVFPYFFFGGNLGGRYW